MSVIAIVPVREGSTRVKGKNFRNFLDGKSLLQIKLEQLVSSNEIDKIVVASNSEIAKKEAGRFGVDYQERTDYMCNDAKLHEYLMDMLQPNKNEDDVLWAMVTNPLFSDYDSCIKEYYVSRGTGYDSLVTTLDFRDFLVDEVSKRCINFDPGVNHTFTQNLPKWKQITGAVYMANVGLQRDMKYWMGRNPFYYDVSKIEAIEVDYMDDFKLAQIVARGMR